jgi:hypothetical protein
MEEPPLIENAVPAGGLVLVTGNIQFMRCLTDSLHSRAVAFYGCAGDDQSDVARLINQARDRFREAGLPRPAVLVYLAAGHAAYEFVFNEAAAVFSGTSPRTARVLKVRDFPHDGRPLFIENGIARLAGTRASAPERR